MKFRVLCANISFVPDPGDHEKVLKATKAGRPVPEVQRVAAVAGDVVELPEHAVGGDGFVVGRHIEVVDGYGNKKKASKSRRKE